MNGTVFNGAYMSYFRLSGLVALAIAVFQANAQQPVTSGPLVREGATEKISAHAYVIPDGSVGGVPNVGFVVGTRATLVIDTGMGKQNGEVVLREARKLNDKNALYLVTTHVHPEHDLGAHAFPAATKMIRAQAQVDEIAATGMATANAFRGRSPQMAQLLEGAEFRKADEIFDKEKALDLGGVKVKLLSVGPNHTMGDTVIVVEGEGVVFSGDVAMKAAPAFASPASSVNEWLKSLDTLDALKPKIIVPAHGPMGDAKFIADYREYLTTIRARAATLKKEGRTVEQTTEVLTAELKDNYPNAGQRLAGAIRAAYREAP
jgi:glyoxylase-like metal-dependent hydrolase (beta-lactamase superfamily II)